MINDSTDFRSWVERYRKMIKLTGMKQEEAVDYLEFVVDETIARNIQGIKNLECVLDTILKL
ncbi:hypothetical protein A0H76_215 [Hepatospora eriocheir]|uniref:Uncharacterized protein n=1 Tax=Hepatospora eriocheir TaxID=1081669 RepID=A0A1X0QJ17_9MICR|nr:hypothetical protein A0H76_215 [Hepatospora eriocheir]